MTTQLVPAEVRNRATVRDVATTEMALATFPVGSATAADWVDYLVYASEQAAVDHRFSALASMGSKDYGATD